MEEPLQYNHQPEPDSLPVIMDEAFNAAIETAADDSDKTSPAVVDTARRRGFFEAIRNGHSPAQRIQELLAEYEQLAKEKLVAAEKTFAKRQEHLNIRISLGRQRLYEISAKLGEAENYNEWDDQTLKMLKTEQEIEEVRLIACRNEILALRKNLSAEKKNIISTSLKDAETQLNAALSIQETFYNRNKELNKVHFEDEKAYLDLLKAQYQELFDHYKERYDRVQKHIIVLDVDGLSPVTSRSLVAIGSVAFGAAGFFFSTFAGNAGFSNKGIISFIIQGIMNMVGDKNTGNLMKVLILLGLILLVSAVAAVCQYLAGFLKNSPDDDIVSTIRYRIRSMGNRWGVNYKVKAEGNNLLAFWLQLTPVVLVVGLLIIAVAKIADANNINALNASSEGLVIGSSLAVAFSGLIYLYVIKIVEPRLVKFYNEDLSAKVNWLRCNWELVTIILVFLLFSIVVAALPYTPGTGDKGNLLSAAYSTRYAILLFIAICLVGGISFAYGIRGRSLALTSRFLERTLIKLGKIVAECSSAEVPQVNNYVSEEHGNMFRNILAQFNFKTSLASEQDKAVKKEDDQGKSKKITWPKFSFMRLAQPALVPEPYQVLVELTPWEKGRYPQFEDELKVLGYSYHLQYQKVQAAAGRVEQHRSDKQNARQEYKDQLDRQQQHLRALETAIEDCLKQQAEKMNRIRNTHNKIIIDLLDGFHLGIWYRENEIGPVNGYFISERPPAQAPVAIIHHRNGIPL